MDDYGKLQELINWLLVLIPLGGAVRVAPVAFIGGVVGACLTRRRG